MNIRLLGLLAALLAPAAFAQLNVSTATSRVAEGQDFATDTIGDSWDMDEPSDIVLYQSRGVEGEAFSGGIYSAVVADNDPRFWLLFPGLPNAIRLDNGDRFAIDPSVYRYLTLKIRYLGSAGEPQPLQVLYYPSAPALPSNPEGFGQTGFTNVPGTGWQIVTVDLQETGGFGGTAPWTSLDRIRGLRIDPTAGAGNVDVAFELDWVRLTAAPSADQRSAISWSGGSAPYTVTAIDGDGASFALGMTGSRSLDADFSRLFPGVWTIAVIDSGVASGTTQVRINDAPVVRITNPDLRGNQAAAYGIVETGNSWSSIDPGDIATLTDIENVSYGSPIGTLSGVATTSDPRILMDVDPPLDTGVYRKLCFTFEIEGLEDPEIDVGCGAVARVLWGNNLSSLTASKDIVVNQGVNEYCVGDMRDLPTEGDVTGTWTGALDFLRFDPHEWALADVPGGPTLDQCLAAFDDWVFRLRSLQVAPVDQANPSFNITWSATDRDDAATTLSLFADTDQDPDNGRGTLIASGLAAANGAFLWSDAPGTVGNGEYFLYAEISDGLDTTGSHATGLLLVGPASATDITVTEPNGSGDTVPEAVEFGAAVRGDRYDMSEAGDVVADLSRNVSGETISGGYYSATATSNDPAIFLLDPTAGGVTIDTSRFRYLTMKVRLTGQDGPHIPAALYYTQNSFDGATVGVAPSTVALDRDRWEIVTIDLLDDRVAGPTWTSQATVPGLRIDPTNVSDTTMEIDWVTLTGPPSANSDFAVQWTSTNLGAASLAVNLFDQDGARLAVASGLAAATSSAVANLTHLPPGPYSAEVIASPGPTGISSGPLTVGEGAIDAVAQTVEAPEGDPGDGFGAAVAVSGELLAFGAPGDDESGPDAGAVLIFRREGTNLVFERKLLVPPGFTAAEFGASLAFEGNVLVIGAPGNAPARKGLAQLQAAIFERLGNDWTLKVPLAGAGSDSPDDGFGTSVAISGSSVVVGAPDDDDGEAGQPSGAAYLFQFDGDNAVLMDKKKDFLGTSGAGYGQAVAAGAGGVAVGAPGLPGVLAGSVALYDAIGQNLATLTGSNAATADDGFGTSVSLAGNMLVVGAPGEDGDRGAAYLFGLAGSTATMEQRFGGSDGASGDQFGAAVATNGDRIVVGAPGAQAPGGGAAGTAFLFQASARAVIEQGRAMAGPGDDAGGFGRAVAVSATDVLIGAPDSGAGRGVARLVSDRDLIFRGGFERR